MWPSSYASRFQSIERELGLCDGRVDPCHDSPHAKGYYGGTVSAPIFKRIAEASLRHLGIPPTVNAPSPVMPVVQPHPSEGMGPDGVIRNVGTGAPQRVPVVDGEMPDLRGLSAREALRTLTSAGLTARMTGQGFVVEQSPAAGTILGGSNTCVLKLARRALPAPTRGTE